MNINTKILEIIMESTLFVVLFWLMIALSGCRSVAPVVVDTPHNDSIVLRYEFKHDSVYIDRIHYEKQKGDTIILRDTVTLKYFSIQNKCDTLYRDKEVVVQLPAEKYTPAFYKWCTGLFWAILVLVIGYIIWRIVKKFYSKT